MKSTLKQMTVPLIFMLFGLIFFAVGSGMTVRQRTLEKQGIEASGVVVNLQENYNDDSTTYTPIVQFTTTDGQKVEFVASYSSSPPAYNIGESVIVVYPPHNPTKAIIKGDGQILHILFMLLGGIFLMVGFVQLFAGIRNMAFIQPGE